MAITKCAVQQDMVRGGQAAQFTLRGNKRTEVYHVEFNALSDYPDAVATAVDPGSGTAVPALGSVDPRHSRRVAVSITPRILGGQGEGGINVAAVAVDYDTQTTFAGYSASSISFEADPVARMAEVEWGFRKEPRVRNFAIARKNRVTGNYDYGTWTTDTVAALAGVGFPVYTSIPITNSAGQPFDPPPMYNHITMVGIMERWQRTWDAAQALAYVRNDGAVNSDWFLGFPPGMCRIEDISARRRVESGELLWRVRYEVHIADHWLDVVPDVGFAKADEGSTLQIVDGNGIPSGAPVRLDGAGQPLANQQTDNTEYMIYFNHDLLPFSVLNLE